MKKTFNENKNYYALLGVSETASKDTLDNVKFYRNNKNR